MVKMAHSIKYVGQSKEGFFSSTEAYMRKKGKRKKWRHCPIKSGSLWDQWVGACCAAYTYADCASYEHACMISWWLWGGRERETCVLLLLRFVCILTCATLRFEKAKKWLMGDRGALLSVGFPAPPEHACKILGFWPCQAKIGLSSAAKRPTGAT